MLTCLVNGKKINIFDYDDNTLKKWSNENILMCPICGKPYEYCHGKVKQPYFRHKEKEQCAYKYYEAETDEHNTGKIDIYNWLKHQNGIKNLELEKYLLDTKQIPDIYFEYNNKKYVIEYQCSPIATEYLERHELYKSAGINDIWICGAQKYFDKYHDGKGLKRYGILEKESALYYDPLNKVLYYKSDDNVFLSDIKNNGVNFDKTPWKYRCSTVNYSFVKDVKYVYKNRMALVHFYGFTEGELLENKGVDSNELEGSEKVGIVKNFYIGGEDANVVNVDVWRESSRPALCGVIYCRMLKHTSINKLLKRNFNQHKIKEAEYEDIFIRNKNKYDFC